MCSETSQLGELICFFLACCPPYLVLCLLLLPSARSKVAFPSRALEVPQVAPGGLSVGYRPHFQSHFCQEPASSRLLPQASPPWHVVLAVCDPTRLCPPVGGGWLRCSEVASGSSHWVESFVKGSCAPSHDRIFFSR